MEADWEEINAITLPAPFPLETQPTPASALAFDTLQELLWIGNEYGRVTSFNGPQLRRYTSYRGHPSGNGPVKQLLFHERGVISVAPTSVHFSSRRGISIWHLEDETTKNLRCTSFVGKDHGQIIAAGCQREILKIDVEKGRVIDKVPSEHEYEMIKHSKYICAATTNGSVHLLDSDNLRIVKTLSTNNVGICDMDARNNFLVTCGWVNHPQGTPMLAGLANVYDLRAMIQLPPVPFQLGAAHVQMHPKMSTTCILASQSGQLQVVDLMNPNAPNIWHANISNYLNGLVLAPSGEALAIADADGSIRLWASPIKVPQFAEYHASPLDWDDVVEGVPILDLSQDVPLSTVGMPYYREQLLSVWSNTKTYDIGHPPSKIDPAILQAVRPANDIGLWANNPRIVLRNQAEQTRLVEPDGAAISAPKFLSEKSPDAEIRSRRDEEVDELQDAIAKSLLTNATKSDVPIMYRNVEIKYSNFGIEDFDFEFYNRTKYSGLETHIPNSYTNPLLQLLKFTPLFRNLALQHAATSCLFDTCLLCELGFLFDTMEKAEGKNCQATNFLKTYSNIPQASRMGLLEENSQGASLADMIQAACRFLLSQTADDYRRDSSIPTLFEQTIAVDALTSIRCVHCHNETIRPGGGYITDLTYSQSHSPNHKHRQSIPTFSQILKASIELQNQTRGWCDKCRRYQQLATRKGVRRLPDMMMINAALKTAETRQYWSVPGWLPDKIGLIIDNGKFFCVEGEDLRLHLEKGLHVVKVYDLVGIVVDVDSGEHQKSHLVSLINVDIFSPTSSDGSELPSWHLFNDFLVRRVSKEDALTFPTSWKLPAVLAFQAKVARQAVDDSWKSNLDTTLLYESWSINNRLPEDCQALDPATEAPLAGSYVAIDTEFVKLQREEIEVKADGKREIIRPPRLGLARVSVLRGYGENEGLPFINDYITVREDIVDYLTQYSGVSEGDLDPRYSPHNLVPLKVAYKKLWLLLNLGCIFIGHGLVKDFRTINIHVPKAQVLDTVNLFFIKSGKRKLSLRYLAWYLLKEDIQTGNHDSIEDARSALKLLRKYDEYRDAGIIDTMIEEVYREGKKWNYRPPGEAAALAKKGADASSSDMLGVPLINMDGGETPDLLTGHSGPGTPTPIRRALERSSEYFGSPLR